MYVLVLGWGRDSLAEYGNQNQENVKGQSRNSILTFIVLPHMYMYVPDILHDIRVPYKLLTLGQQVLSS